MHERKDAGRGQPRVNPDLCEWLETREGGLLEEGLLGFQEGEFGFRLGESERLGVGRRVNGRVSTGREIGVWESWRALG